MLTLSLLIISFFSSKLSLGSSQQPDYFEFPYVALLQIKSDVKKAPDIRACAATIINSHIVLTSAHCVSDFKNFTVFKLPTHNARVIAGSGTPLQTSRYWQKATVRDFLIHPDYDMVTYGSIHSAMNDVALVSLEKGFVIKYGVQPIKFTCTNKECMDAEYAKFVKRKILCFAPGWLHYNKHWIIFAMAHAHMISPQKCDEVFCDRAQREDCNMNLNLLQATCTLPHDEHRVCGGAQGGPLLCTGHVFAVVNTPTCRDDTPAKHTNLMSIITLLRAYKVVIPVVQEAEERKRKKKKTGNAPPTRNVDVATAFWLTVAGLIVQRL